MDIQAHIKCLKTQHILSRDECKQADLLLQHGAVCFGRTKPESIDFMPQKECFKNAFMLSSAGTYVYTEGFGQILGTDLITPHAWCVNDFLEVIDPTWMHPEKRAYIGISFEWKAVETLFFDVFGGRAFPVIPYIANLSDDEAKKFLKDSVHHF